MKKSYLILIIFITIGVICLTKYLCSEPSKEWIRTTDGIYLWDYKFQGASEYSWTGNHIGPMAMGDGELISKINGKVIHKKKLNTYFGSTSADDWHTMKNDSRYCGTRRIKKPHGYAFCIQKDTSLGYFGFFKKGKLEGNEVYIYKLKDENLNFNWDNGKPSGYCKVYYNGVLRYDGDISRGKLSGRGKEYSLDGNLVYKGGFKKGLHEGKGTSYDNGVLVYQGGWHKGKYDGDGVLYENSKLYYEGHFRDSLFNGYGIAYYPTGHPKYKGNWKEGAYDGEGSLYENGQILSGLWDMGHFLKPFEKRVIDNVVKQFKVLTGQPKVATNMVQLQENEDVDAVSFITTSLQDNLYDSVKEKVKDNIEKRYGFFGLPRMLWQSLFTRDSRRMEYAQKQLTDGVDNIFLAEQINEQTRNYSFEHPGDIRFGDVILPEYGHDEIVNERVFEQINIREQVEWSDVILGIVVDLIVACIIYLVSFFKIKTLSWIPTVISFIIGIPISLQITARASSALEDIIVQMVTENIMTFINNQNIITQLLTW